ncbi:hypothetical protein EIB41_19050 [Salmonella enterica subsp. enterica serovar Typhimurium]|nr:hypothetical protein [Salmonella enterica]EDR3715506.1 hypothetical protein [Salmonella enterica subsp. enterica serovar Abony]TXB54856.1 hypothetical protein EIB41_19050 [Salmonella enterica subsp. enterica serovar Typhimurium]
MGKLDMICILLRKLKINFCIVSMSAFDVSNYRITVFFCKSFLSGNRKKFNYLKINVLEINSVFAKVFPK